MTPVEELTGFPGVPRRPGQDPAPAGPRRHPGRPSPGVARGAARRARHRAVRPGGVQPLPVPPDRRVGRDARRVRRADRHRRDRRWCGPPRRTTRRSRSSRRRASTTSCWPPCHRVATRSRSAGGLPQRPSRTRRRTTSRSPSGSPRSWPCPPASGGRSSPVRPSSGQRSCGTARTRTRRPRSTPTPQDAPGLAQAEQLHGKEMSYNNYVDAHAAHRAVVRLQRPGRGDHQALQPVRHRGRG